MALRTACWYETGEYWSSNPTFHLGDSLFKARNVVKALELCGIGENLRVCDLGCGAGGVLHHVYQLLSEQGIQLCEVHGYDISEKAIAQGSVLFPELQLEIGSVRDVGDGYDIILVLDVLEHLERYYEFLQAVQHKASLYVFHIPMDMTALRVLHQSELLETWDKMGHIHQFCEATAIRVLNTAGFEVVHRHWTAVDLHQEAKAERPCGYKRRLVNVLRKILFPIVPSFAVALLGGKSLMIVAKDADTSATWTAFGDWLDGCGLSFRGDAE